MKLRWSVLLVLVLLLAALAYLPGLSGPLVLDDRANLEPLVAWLHGQINWQSVVFGNGSGVFGRSVSMATFLANAAVGGESVYGFKLVNLLIHLLNGIAIYALFSGILRAQAITHPGSKSAAWMPLLATSLWLLHPLLVSTVLYVVQRMAMLSALFMLLTMLAYVHGRLALDSGHRRRAWMLLGLLAPASTLLATLSKENGILAPALCGLIEWLVFAPTAGDRRRWPSKAFIALVLAVPALLAIALTLDGNPRIVGGYENRSFTLAERLLTQPRVLWHYVGAILLPYGPRLGLYHDDFPVSHGLLSPPGTLLAIAGWIVALVLAWRVRRTAPAIALGVGIFLVGQALESSVFPLLMYFEHRVYLPSIGIIWALLGLTSFAAERLDRRMHHGRQIFTGAAVALVTAFGFATVARVSVWRSQDGILLQALATHPNSRWLRMDLVGRDMAQRPPATVSALRHADHLMNMPDPLDQRFGAMLRLSIECIQGAPATGVRLDQVFGGHPLAIEPDLLVGYEGLAERIIKTPCQDLGPATMASALAGMLDRTPLPAADRSIWRLRFKTAKLYWAAGNLQAALQQAKLAYAPGSSDPAVAVMIAGLLLQSGDSQGAGRMLDRVESRIVQGDVAGRAIVKRYREQIAQGR